MKALYKAMLEAQKKITYAVKDKANQHFRSKYATLESVIEAIKKPLNENGIFISHHTEKDGLLVTQLIHAESGESIKSEFQINVESLNPQQIGSASTYAKRYNLTALLSLPTEDDDGEEASKPVAVKEAPKVKFRFQGGKFKDRNFADVPQAEFDNYLEYLSGLTVKNRATLDTIAEMQEFKKQKGI